MCVRILFAIFCPYPPTCVTAAGCNGSSTHSSHELIGYRRDDLKLNKTAVRFEKWLLG